MVCCPKMWPILSILNVLYQSASKKYYLYILLVSVIQRFFILENLQNEQKSSPKPMNLLKIYDDIWSRVSQSL